MQLGSTDLTSKPLKAPTQGLQLLHVRERPLVETCFGETYLGDASARKEDSSCVCLEARVWYVGFRVWGLGGLGFMV